MLRTTGLLLTSDAGNSGPEVSRLGFAGEGIRTQPVWLALSVVNVAPYLTKIMI